MIRCSVMGPFRHVMRKRCPPRSEQHIRLKRARSLNNMVSSVYFLGFGHLSQRRCPFSIDAAEDDPARGSPAALQAWRDAAAHSCHWRARCEPLHPSQPPTPWPLSPLFSSCRWRFRTPSEQVYRARALVPSETTPTYAEPLSVAYWEPSFLRRTRRAQFNRIPRGA